MTAPPPYTTVTHVRSLTGITAAEKQDRDIAMAIEYAWREIRAKAGHTLDGLIDKEFLGKSDGKRYKYRSRFYPVLDEVIEAGGVATNGTTKIQIYTVDTATPETFTSVATTSYLLHGEDGLILFKSTTIPNAGLEIYVSYKYSPDANHHVETLLAAYYVYQSMPNSKEKSMEYLNRFSHDFATLVMPVLDDIV